MTRVGDKTPLFISVLTTHKDSVRIGIGYPDPSTSGKPNASSGSRRYAKAPTPSQSIRPGLGTCTRHGSQLVIIPAGPAGFGEVQLVVATESYSFDAPTRDFIFLAVGRSPIIFFNPPI